VESVDFGLEVIVRALGSSARDATNYLGGIGDVLQDKRKSLNLDLSHDRVSRRSAIRTNTKDCGIR
jgi:hypothetical protein